MARNSNINNSSSILPSNLLLLHRIKSAFDVVKAAIDDDEEFCNYDLFTEVDQDILEFTGGIPARNAAGDRLLLFIGIIDILQR